MNTIYKKEVVEDLIQKHWNDDLTKRDNSLNKKGILQIKAKAKALFKGGNDGLISDVYPLWQVSKEDSDMLISKKNILKEYSAWINNQNASEQDKQNHLNNLKEWIEKRKKEGFIIEWMVW